MRGRGRSHRAAEATLPSVVAHAHVHESLSLARDRRTPSHLLNFLLVECEQAGMPLGANGLCNEPQR